MNSTVIRKTGELAGTRACRWWAGIVTLVGALLSSTPLRAQITLDGSLGPRQTLTGPNFTIGADLGQIRGHNLFHSFDKFNIRTSESATFTGPAYIGNILSRVTGGSPSSINGLLRSEIQGANFFLINPSGVVFLPNAALDVSGSFHVSTADFIRFVDRSVFYANLGKQSVLTVKEPAAFGFLNANPAAISVQESVLRVPEGRSLSLVGGNVSIVGGVPGLLQARSGRISVISVASTGEVSFDAATQAAAISAGSFTRLGTIELSDQALLDTTGAVGGPGSGTIAIRGGRLVMRDSELRSNSRGDTDGARVGIDVRVAEEVILNNGLMGTRTSAGGRAGDITVEVGRLSVAGGSSIDSETAGSGQGGAITIRAADSVSVTGSGPSGPSLLLSSTDSAAASGPITVSAPTVSLDSGAVVLSRTTLGASGNAGNVLINDTDRLTLSGGSSVSSMSFGRGRAGDVTVAARESVSVEQLSQISSTVAPGRSGNPGRVLVSAPTLRIDNATVGGVSPPETPAAAGDVEVRARTVALSNGGIIAAETAGVGSGGTISITGFDPGQPADLVSLSGSGSVGPSRISNQTAGSGSAGLVSVSSRTVTVDGGQILNNTFSSGKAGNIELNVGALTLTNAGVVSSSTGVQATGRGGTVTVMASDSVALTSRSMIGAFSLGRGDAGSVSVSAPSLNMSGGAAIATTAVGGRAGSVVIEAARLSMSGATIDSTTFGAGSGGNVAITAREIDLRSGAVISANSESTGDAGNISIIASGSFRSHNSTIATAALQGEGGNIVLTAGRLVQLVGTQMTTSVQSGVGGGGNITIDPRFVILDHSQISANAFGGPGGNVRIVADIFLTTDSILSASSALGASGTINIQSPITDVSGTLARLPEAVFQAAALLRAACQVRLAEGRTSSFVLGGRGGLAIEPGGLLGSPLLDDPVEASPAATPLNFSPLSFAAACR